jgi:phosphoadenosine phosphosulfate reductase
MFGEKYKPDEAIKMLKYYESLALERDKRGYAVGFSGGKDSLVLSKIFQESDVKHFYMYNITGIDPPELVYFKRKKFNEYREKGYLCYDFMHQKSIIQLLVEHLTPPTRKMRFCCAELKEKERPEVKGCVRSFGVRKYESNSRMKKRNELEAARGKDRKIFSFDNDDNRRQFETCYSTGSPIIRINPLAYWYDSDVWDFIKDRKLEYCNLYDEGFERLGCVGCPMAGKHREIEFQRWPGLRRVWEIGFNKMWKARSAKGMGWWKGIKTESDLWDWWLEDTNMDIIIDGQTIFEFEDDII